MANGQVPLVVPNLVRHAFPLDYVVVDKLSLRCAQVATEVVESVKVRMHYRKDTPNLYIRYLVI